MPPAAPAPEPEAEPGDILVVDDTPENITVLRDILVRAGHRVRPALNGALALRAIETQCPDLVLLDIMMPGLDGYQTCARIHALPAAHDLPVLFISALDGTEDKLRAFREGGVDYVAKPFQAAEVLARVQVHLRLRAARRRLARQNRELEAAARLRDEVDALLRHDLKSPLATILAAAETIAGAVPSDTSPAVMCGYIREAGTLMLEQIHHSLDLLKMERGLYPLRPAPLDLQACIHKIITELALTPAGRRVPVRILAAASPEAWWVEGESLLCHGLFRNLLKNALEASPEAAGVAVTIACSPPAPGGDPVITLANHGEVPPEIRPRLFQKFATAGKAGGTGLGAYSARLFAETQRGSIRLVPAPPGQTAIAVTLPRAKSAPPLPGPAPTPVSSFDAASAPRRVLIADDDPAHADAVARLLASAGLDTVLARDATEAGARLARGDCAAALVDFEMPGGKGPAVARAHRETGGRARLIALTAHDDPEIHAACLAAGFDRVLVKPAGKALLLAELAGDFTSPRPPPVATPTMAAGAEPATEVLDPDLLPLLPAFLATRATELSALAAALAAGDTPEVRVLSHRLRGGFSIYGFAAASAACAAIERAAATGDAASSTRHLAELTRTLEGLRLQAAASA